MAWTIKPVNRNGTFEIYEDGGQKIGYGRMKVSTTEDGMVTLTLQAEELVGWNFLVLRVPIDWTQALAELPFDRKVDNV